jgi:hypothetical protein
MLRSVKFTMLSSGTPSLSASGPTLLIVPATRETRPPRLDPIGPFDEANALAGKILQKLRAYVVAFHCHPLEPVSRRVTERAEF